MTALIRRRLTAATVALTAVWLPTGSVHAQSTTPAYGVTDLGTIGGTSSVALAVGPEGYPNVAGYGTTDTGQEHAFAGYNVFGVHDLGTFGGARSEARAVNRDTTVGFAQRADGAYRAFAAGTSGTGGLIELGTLGGRQSYALDIDAAGAAIVGVSETAQAGVNRPFLYDVATRAFGEIPVSLGGPSAAATAVTTLRHVAGYADVLLPGVHHAFFYANGVVHDLGSFGGNSEARAINESDVVVGAAWLDVTTRHAFRAFNGALQDLGTLGGASSEATDIAGDGTIVGWAEDGSGARHAFVWRNGAMTDLNTLIPADSGWVLEAASGVNTPGAIVGYGRLGGQLRAFFLTPPIDLRVDLRFHERLPDTNLPNPHETGQLVEFGVTVKHDASFAATGVTVVNTFTGAVDIVSTSPSCLTDGLHVTCRIERPVETFVGRDVFIDVRSTAAGPITHTATVTSDQPDPNPANSSASVSNTAVSLASLTAAGSSIIGGQPLLMRVTLTSSAGGGGARVPLASSNPAIASVPERFDVRNDCCDGGLWREFYLVTTPVTVPTTVQISAGFGLVTQALPITILPAGGGGGDGSLVTWTDPVNVTVGPGTIQKTAGCDGCFDASALSTQAIGASGGALQFTITDPSRLLVAGVSDASGPPTDVDFGIRVGGQWADVRENGAYRTDVPVVAGDVFRVAVSGSGVVTYARNGQVFYTSARAATPPLRAAVVLVAAGARLDQVSLSGGGTIPPTADGTPVTWTALVNATLAGDRLTKTSGCDGCYDASGMSTETIALGGAVAFTVVDPTRVLVAGLSDGSGAPTDVDFGIAHGGAFADVRENGVYRADVPVVAGDVFRIAVSASGVVTYARNGQVFYTSSRVATAPLRVVAVLAEAGASLEHAVVYGASTTPPTTSVTWAALVNVTANGDRVTKTAGCDGCFDAIAQSTQAIGAGGGAVEFTVVDPTRLLVAGLSDGTGGPTDVDFGIDHGGAAADVRENGAYRTDVPVVAGDVFRIAVSASGVVTYARNDQVFYTSAVTASAPLRFVAVMAAAGASVEQVTITGAAASATTDTAVR